MEWVSGNIFIRAHGPLRAGERIAGHQHAFDHTTIVFRGRVHVRAALPDGSPLERDFGESEPTGRYFLVRAGIEHEIIALDDGTEYWCIYSHRTPQGEVIQYCDGWHDAYR